MTGRELIMFILVNNLEDTKLSLSDFVLSTVEAAQKFNVGLATIHTWVLEEKINNPDISLAKIAKKRKITRQAVHKYLKAKCESIPEIAAIMFNRRHRKKNHSEYCSENLTQERTRFSPALS